MNIVDLANEHVSILEVCRQINLAVPDEVLLGRSVKVMCPQGDVTHPDGGIDPAFRVYPDTNTAWCFVCSEFFTPVKLYIAAMGGSREDAAERLLTIVGYNWTALQEFQPLTPEKRPDHASLAEALKLWCARNCMDWDLRQLDNDISTVLSKCLALLPQVRTGADVEKWLEISKTVMQRTLTID